MPPKAKEVVLPPSIDDKPYGAFVICDISSLVVELVRSFIRPVGRHSPVPTCDSTPLAYVQQDPPAVADAAAPAPPKVHLSISLPAAAGDYSPPGVSAPADYDASAGRCTLDLQLRKAFRREPTMDTLAMLLNSPAQLSLIHTSSNTVLASASLDMVNLGWGKEAWELSGVTLTPALEDSVATNLPKVTSALVGTVVMSVRSRVEVAAEPGAPPDPAATAAAQSTPLQPYTFITPELLEGSNIAELTVSSSQAAPPGLLAASTTAGGKLTLSAAVSLPGSAPVLMRGIAVKDGSVAWGNTYRQWLPAAAIKALKWHLEDSLPVVFEMARYVTADGLSDPAFEHYHCGAELAIAPQLLVAGATQAALEVPLMAFNALAVSRGTVLATCLPPYTPPIGKAKPVEDVPAAALAEGSLGAWAECSSSVTVTLRLLVPLLPPWSPPQAPSRSLVELIPTRDLTPVVVPSTAADDFKAQVRTVALALAAEYMRIFPQEHEDASMAETSGSADMVEDPSCGTGGGERQKLLVFELNRSGQYLQLKDSLKAAVMRLVRDKYNKSGSMSPAELSELYNQLYIDLMDQLHIALTGLGSAAVVDLSGPQVPAAARLVSLLQLAQELEVAGDAARAEVLHQQRIIADTLPQVWYDYATFCLRTGQHGRAEECLKASLALAPQHVGSLCALACLSLHQGRVTDALFLDMAETACAAARDVEPQAPLVWALSIMVFRAQGESREAQLASSIQELERIEREALDLHRDAVDANGFIAVAGLLLELCLPQAALDALELVATLRHSAEALGHQVMLQRTKALSQLGSDEELQAALKELRRQFAEDVYEPALIAGDAAWRAGHHEAAVMMYQAALQADPAACPLSLHLRLGDCYLALGQPEHAATVYARGVELRPCSSVWLGVGRAQLLLGDVAAAELALQEANVLDGGNSLVWGWLVLASLRANRLEAASSAFKYALQAGLSNVPLLIEIANEYQSLGHLRPAQTALLAALKVEDTYMLRMQIGQLAAAQEEPEISRAHLQAALGLANDSVEADNIQSMLAML